MPTFTLLDTEVVPAIHEEQLAIHGGGIGVRDRGLLESALARPENKLAYEPEADSAAIAAASAFGIARTHSFVHGNKRSAFVAMETFLLLNGRRLIASDQDALISMLRLASGGTEDQFAAWIRENLSAR